ncbi:MAG: homoserine dehydrogenase [Rhodospirillaceae bacterium]|nr:homoserine dehydrogenase [Rhodospirillaceae bacterium]
MNEPLKIAVAGLGTVGAGILKLLAEHGDMLEGRCGRRIEVTAVSAREQGKDRGVSLEGLEFFQDAAKMARDADADVIVELIGGADGIAKETVEAAITASRHVVTANKALIAHHGTELALKAEAAGVSLAYEAAVAGGIPIIKALREGLAANGIKSIHGILNGTCNYILSRMRDEGLEFVEVLEDAQRLGYAETDPEFDIEGVDAAHKLAILASLAFGRKLNFDGVHIEGITRISQMDIRFAEELGFRVKLLGIASQNDHGIEQRVHPCLVPADAPIASVEGVFNAVVAEGDFVDTLMMEGRGAGEGPTASAVCADLADIARGIQIPAFGIPAKKLEASATVSMDAHKGAYYIRLMVIDRPGIFADVATTLRDNEVSMESILQHGRGAPGEAVPVVVTLHETEEVRASAVIETISHLDGVLEAPVMIRIENL